MRPGGRPRFRQSLPVGERVISATCSVVSWARKFSSLSYGHVCTLRVLTRFVTGITSCDPPTLASVDAAIRCDGGCQVEHLRVGVLEEDEVYGRGVMAVLNEDGCVCIDLGGDRETSSEAADAARKASAAAALAG